MASRAFQRLAFLAIMSSLGALAPYAASHADDGLPGLLPCKHRRATVAGAAQVHVRLYPLAFERRAIPAKGTALGSLMADTALHSIAAARLTTVDDSIPDTILWVHENQVTVFPRILLLHPVVSRALVRDGDLIAMESWNQIAGDGAAADPIRVLLERAIGPRPSYERDKPIHILLAGPLMPAEARGWQRLDSMRLSSYLNTARFQGAKLEQIVASRTGRTLAASQPVCLVTRSSAALQWRFICPLKETGLFATDGGMMRSLWNAWPEGAALNRWNQLFGNKLYSIPLLDNDIVEWTPLESVSPFAPD